MFAVLPMAVDCSTDVDEVRICILRRAAVGRPSGGCHSGQLRKPEYRSGETSDRRHSDRQAKATNESGETMRENTPDELPYQPVALRGKAGLGIA